MSTASTGRPSCVRNSALTVPSRACASRSSVSVENGTSSASVVRSAAGRAVLSAEPPAPRAVHAHTCLERKRGSPRAARRSSRRARSIAVHGSFAGPMRLAKHLAHAGVASRRAAEGMIAAGRVTVDGATVTDPARDVSGGEAIAVDGERLGAAPRHVVYAVNKPAGVVSTAHDTHGRPTVVDLVPEAGTRLAPGRRLLHHTPRVLPPP